jgi:hypothetical protein
MSESNSNKNKELDPNNRERNLQEYNSEKIDVKNDSTNKQQRKQSEHHDTHGSSCGCGH